MVTKRTARQIASRQRQMERDVGVNPKFRHGPKASAAEIAAWERLAHDWLIAHAKPSPRR